MSKPHTLDKLKIALFEGKKDGLSESDLNVLRRYKAGFTAWLDEPTMRDSEMRVFLIANYHVSESQAYRDIANLKFLLGNVRNANKEWQRYKVIDMLDEAYNRAKEANDVKAMVMAADKLGKYTQLDQKDDEVMPWEEIIPQTYEVTSDPSVLGITPIPNHRKKITDLLKKYSDDIEFEDMREYKELEEVVNEK
jgi:hypothetical protein